MAFPALNGLRVAVYARFSSDKQSDASIEDQVHRAREWLRAQGGSPDHAQVFSDFATSGASMNRPGMRALEQAIRTKTVDFVITESVDRISRDVEDAARFRKLLTHHKVELACLDGTRLTAAGKSDAMMFGMRSLFAEQYSIDLADKTLRGLEGNARKGAPTGAVAYGYRIKVTATADPKRPVREVEVDNERAQVVRHIFNRYAAGDSFATIAEKLNAERVAPPRAHSRRSGEGWMHSAVRSILLNERYIGRWTYGEREWVKAPGTNTRRPQARRGGPLLTNERDDLVIVGSDTWAAVQARFARHASMPRGRRSYMLSGLLHCGVCGARMQHNGGGSRPYFACSHAVKRRSCTNRRNVPVTVVETQVLQKICSELTECMDEVRALVEAEVHDLARSLPSRRRELEQRSTNVEKQILRLIDLVASSDSSMAAQRVRELEAERASLRAMLADLREEPRALPSLADFLADVQSLESLTTAPADEAREVLRPLLRDGKLFCMPLEDRWHLNFGLLPAVLMARRPHLGSLGRPSDADGCGGAIRAASDATVVECEITFAA